MNHQFGHATCHRNLFGTAHGRVLAVIVVFGMLLAAGPRAAAQPVEVEVLRSDRDGILLEFRVDDFFLEPVDVGHAMASRVVLSGEAVSLVAGEPELPRIARSVAIPRDRRMALRVLHAEYEVLEDVDIVPSKGNLYRNVDPATVPYEWGPVYGRDAFHPEPLVETGEPYIMRDVRGLTVTLNPVRYNPATRTLEVYRRVVMELLPDGPDHVNIIPTSERRPSAAFETIYRRHFVNIGPGLPRRYPPVTEEGSMLVICHDEWIAEMQPFVEHKNAIGIPTAVVGVSTIGNNPPAIWNHIRSVYQSSDLAFVLLVGDAAQVATPNASGGSSDPSYAKLAGDDHYPDILVGRFSAENAAHVATQVRRTIEYETMPATLEDWFRRGMGIASDEGPGDNNEMDWEHLDVIRDNLLAAGYAHVDQIYDPGGAAGSVTAGVNHGRGVINYTGHGSTFSWATTGFSNNHVDALTNVGMLPFIIAVACVNGNFANHTCFAEAWLRATHNGQPAGAIGMYASSINQSWNPPMAAQDEAMDLFLDEAHFSFGALCFAGSGAMMDKYGNAGVEMYDTWHVFGDPSARVVGVAEPPSGLMVAPYTGQGFIGQAGGPFQPAAVVYTLTNKSDFLIGFSVEVDGDWLVADTDAGELAAGASAEVVLTTTYGAMALVNGHYESQVRFRNTTDGEGDTERVVTIDIGVPEIHYEWDLDEDPGWQTDQGWEFGVPLGQGGQFGPPDPTSGYTGSNVYGFNLAGDYPPNMPERHLTSEPIDCSELTEVTLRFWRWLGVEQPPYDNAYVRVSNDGVEWHTVWRNTAEVADYAWTQVEYDISAIADNQPTVYLRWTMGTTDGGWNYCGWNIDDIEIWGVAEPDCSDKDGDGHLPLYCGGGDCDDNDPNVHPDAEEICDDGIDNNCNGLTDMDDPACWGVDVPDEAEMTPFKPDGSGCGCRFAGERARGLLGIMTALAGYSFPLEPRAADRAASR